MADGNPGCASSRRRELPVGHEDGRHRLRRKSSRWSAARSTARLYGGHRVRGSRSTGATSLSGRNRRRRRPPATSPAPAQRRRHRRRATTPAPSGYRMTDWSPWGRAEGLDYRYRVRWDPASGGPGKTVEAVYEIRNRGSQRFSGAARSVDCAKGSVWGSTDFALAPGESKEVRVRGPNCGSASNPDIRPDHRSRRQVRLTNAQGGPEPGVSRCPSCPAGPRPGAASLRRAAPCRCRAPCGRRQRIPATWPARRPGCTGRRR